jgi:hypothetical protein
MKRKYIIAILFAVIGFTACSKKVDAPAEALPEQIYFDVLAVDNGEATTTQSPLVTVKTNPY